MKHSKEEIVNQLFDVGAVKFGQFKLKSGIMSPVYFDLRVIISYPNLMKITADMLWSLHDSNPTSLVCGVPYTALPLATLISADHNIPMVIRRKEAKDYGTRKILEGYFQKGQECLIIEDCVSTGSSILETVKVLEDEGLVAKTALVFVDRQQGGMNSLQENGIEMKSVFNLLEMLQILIANGRVKPGVMTEVKAFLLECRSVKTPSIIPTRQPFLSYEVRAPLCRHPVARRLLEIISKKQSNLCVAADVTSCRQLCELAREVGPHICMLKTHVDLLEDFYPGLVNELRGIANEHNFLLFEDRKLCDIGKTVSLQVSAGMYKLSSWCDVVTLHGVSGPGVIAGVKEALRGEHKDPQSMGCLLVAEMSSQGTLTTEQYKEACGQMALGAEDMVMGFISQSRVLDDPGYLHCTPGVKLNSSGDEIGQQYNSPEAVVGRGFCDVVIVGRGITEAEKPAESAAVYQKAAYGAYIKLVENKH